jgi:putative ABC transport system substrate-binding protein
VLWSVTSSDPTATPRTEAFEQHLRRLGWEDKRNVRITYRYLDAAAVGARGAAAELAALAPEVIVVQSNLALAALRDQASGTPIVFVAVSDPVGSGFVANLARPGGNITGFTQFEPEMGSKWLQLLKEIAPSMKQVIVLFHPDIKANVAFLDTAKAGSTSIEVAVTGTAIRNSDDIERVLGSISQDLNSGFIVMPNPVHQANRDRIIETAAKHRLAAIYPYRDFAMAGGLASYAIDILELSRNAASYVDRILNGTSPADLPVQQPTKFELVINLKTAKAIGLTIPPTLLTRADEVIE